MNPVNPRIQKYISPDERVVYVASPDPKGEWKQNVLYPILFITIGSLLIALYILWGEQYIFNSFRTIVVGTVALLTLGALFGSPLVQVKYYVVTDKQLLQVMRMGKMSFYYSKIKSLTPVQEPNETFGHLKVQYEMKNTVHSVTLSNIPSVDEMMAHIAQFWATDKRA